MSSSERRGKSDNVIRRVDWKRNGWPDAKFEVRSAKCDLRDEQMAEQRDGEAQGRMDWKRH